MSRQNTSLLEDKGGVLRWTLCGVPTADQLVVDVLEKHLKSTLHAHPVATCDTSMADLIANEWMVAFRPTHDRWGQCCRLEFDNKE